MAKPIYMALFFALQIFRLKSRIRFWIVVLVLSGTNGEVEYQREDMMEMAQENGVVVREELSDVPNAGAKVLEQLRSPKGFYQSPNFSYHPLQFYVSASMISPTFHTFETVLDKYSYPRDRIGYFFLPVEKGRVYYCEYGIHADKGDSNAMEWTRELWTEAARSLLDAGAYFDRVYGPLEELVYARAGVYHSMIKKIKGLLDPNDIMNTGRIC